MIFRIKIYFALLPTMFFMVELKQAHKWLPSDPQRTADYQTPVNILGKYDNLVEKSMHFCLARDKNLTTDVRVAPIITEQTAKLGRFANYLQN